MAKSRPSFTADAIGALQSATSSAMEGIGRFATTPLVSQNGTDIIDNGSDIFSRYSCTPTPLLAVYPAGTPGSVGDAIDGFGRCAYKQFAVLGQSSTTRRAAGAHLRLGMLLCVPLTFVVGCRAAPDTSPGPTSPSQDALAGLGAAVSVKRDARGVPYIEARTLDDLLFAQGYVTAGDRLWQMEYLRRAAAGELSELFGEDTLDEDRQRRTLGLRAVCEASLAAAPARLRRQLEAYAAGVNAFLGSRAGRELPWEFRLLNFRPRPWTPADSLLISKLLAEALTSSWERDLGRLVLRDHDEAALRDINRDVSPFDVSLDVPPRATGRKLGAARARARARQAAAPIVGSPLAAGPLGARLLERRETRLRTLRRIGLHADQLQASNAWAVSGNRSASGKPMLANDPHFDPSAPSLWYLFSLRAPGFQVSGANIPGLPGALVGHNQYLAWGITNMGADVQDLYLETFDGERPRQVLASSGWVDVGRRRELIRVKRGSNDARSELVAHEVTVTPHGPVVFTTGKSGFALAWTALSPDARELELVLELNQARDWTMFRAALAGYRGVPLNFVYADAAGNIGYSAAGWIPRRRSGRGDLPFIGAAADTEWVQGIPFEELPHALNPASGIVVSANNRPVDADFPYYITDQWAPPYRASRINTLLRASTRLLKLDDFAKIQADTVSLPDKLFASELAKAAQKETSPGKPPDPVLAALETWDGRASSSSSLMPVIVAARKSFRDRLLASSLGAQRVPLATGTDVFVDWALTTRPRRWLPSEYPSYDALLLDCYRQATAALGKRLGRDPTRWRWGDLGRVRFIHPLVSAPDFGKNFELPSFPQATGGSAATVNAGGSVSMRFLVDTADWDQTRLGVTLGQSGDPTSAHWDDQLREWQTARPKTVPFSPAAVDRAKVDLVTLQPARHVEPRN
jgi:penicillin G amidase